MSKRVTIRVDIQKVDATSVLLLLVNEQGEQRIGLVNSTGQIPFLAAHVSSMIALLAANAIWELTAGEAL